MNKFIDTDPNGIIIEDDGYKSNDKANGRRIAFDKQSVRYRDENGNLHVVSTPITKEGVAGYYGAELPGWQELGLDPQRMYYGYRPADELIKSIPTWKRMPLLSGHHEVTPRNPQKEHNAGNLGSDVVWMPPYLKSDMVIIDEDAQEGVEDGSVDELSGSYAFRPDFTPGEFNGQHYDFIMRDIKANHVALVDEGRNGKDVRVEDAAPHITPTKDTEMSKLKSGGSTTIYGKQSPNLIGKQPRRKLARDDAPETLEKAETDFARLNVALNVIEAIKNGYEPTDVDVDIPENASVEDIVDLVIPGIGEELKPHVVYILKTVAGLPVDPPHDGPGAPTLDAQTGSATDERQIDGDDLNVVINQEENGDVRTLDIEGVQVSIPENLQALIEEELEILGMDNTPQNRAAIYAGYRARDMRDKKAMDSKAMKHTSIRTNTTMRVSDAVAMLEKKLEEKAEARAEVEPVLGEISLKAFDSAAAMYGAALEEMGISLDDLPPDAYKTIYQRARVADSKPVAVPYHSNDTKFDGDFEYVSRLMGRR